MMYLRYLFALILFVGLMSCRAKKNEPVVLAVIGPQQLTVQEFRERTAFNPLNTNLPVASVKSTILKSLIAEKIMAAHFRDSLSAKIRRVTEQRHREAVIEALWDKEILAGLTVDDSTLWQYYRDSKKRRVIEFISVEDSLAAVPVYENWAAGKSWLGQYISLDTLAADGMLGGLNQAVFQSEIGQVARPFRLGRRYFIFKPTAEFISGPVSLNEYKTRQRSYRKKYLHQAGLARFDQFFRENIRPYQIDLQRFKTVSFALGDLLQENHLTEQTYENEPGLPAFPDGPDLNLEIVRFEAGPHWSVGELLIRIADGPYPVDFSSRSRLIRSLLPAARRTLDDELLYRYAVQKGYDQTADVRFQTDLWQDFYTAKDFADNFSGNAELEEQLKRLGKSMEIRVNWAVYDTLKIVPGDMVVLKTHFPGQTITPPFLPVGYPLQRNGE